MGSDRILPLRESALSVGIRRSAFVEFVKRHAFIASRCLYLLTLGTASRADRKQLRRLGRALGYAEPDSLLPSISLQDLVGDEVTVRIVEADTADWNVDLAELTAINAIVGRFAPRSIFEIGTYDGRTTSNLVANAPPGAIVFTLDLPPGTVEMPRARTVGERFTGTQYESSIVQLFGDSLSYDFSQYRGMIDLVFVDASHHYTHAAHDTKTAVELIQGRQGIILWHDYGFAPGVTRAVDELFSTTRDAQVFAVIRETRLACLFTRG